MKKTQKATEKTNDLWQKTKYANSVRNVSSGNYFARFRHNGKLIWRGLDTDVLTIAAQRLPDKIKELKDEQALLASGSDPRITHHDLGHLFAMRCIESGVDIPICLPMISLLPVLSWGLFAELYRGRARHLVGAFAIQAGR